MLLEKPGRALLAVDNSPDMLAVARRAQPRALERAWLFQASAFAIGLANESVDCVFCMRLLHHVGEAEHRLAMLREFHRVARETLVVSLWVDGNYKSWRRKRLEAQRQDESGNYQNRFVVTRTVIESEFRQAGFGLAGHFDFLPGYAMWRVYVLRK
jgi:SAM-dependent methyltransferase